MKKPKILAICLRSLGRAGVEGTIRTLLEAGELGRHFSRIVLVTTEYSDQPTEAAFLPFADEVIHFGQWGMTESQVVSQVCRVLANERPWQVLFTHSPLLDRLIPAARRAVPQALLSLQVHCFWPAPGGGRIDAGPPVSARRHAMDLDRIVVHSEIVRQRMITELQVSPAKLRHIPHGINQDRFHPDPEPRVGPRRVLWLGRWDWQKDPIMGARVAERYLRWYGGDEVEFHFMGDGPGGPAFYQELGRLASGLPLVRKRVRCGPPQADPSEAIRLASALLMTSRFEGVPLTAVEAMSCGVPIVAPVQDSSIEELAPEAWLYRVWDRENPGIYAEGLRAALRLSLPLREAPPPRWEARRFAAEMREWLLAAPGEVVR